MKDLELFRDSIEQRYSKIELSSGCVGGCFGSILCSELHHGDKNDCNDHCAGHGLHFSALAKKWGISVTYLGELIYDHCRRLEPL
jgi:hypothetical protein